MADVRSTVGVPTVSAFGGTSTPSPSTPIVINDSTGLLYILQNGVVTPVPTSGVSSISVTTPITSTGGATPSIGIVNQGSTTTVLHGNASGNAAFSSLDLSADVTGNLGVAHLNGGSNASIATFWRGDAAWGPGSNAVTLAYSATVSLDITLGDVFDITLTGNATINFTGGTSFFNGKKIILRVTQGGAGSFIPTLGTGIRWGTDIPSITFTTTPGKTDYVGIVYDYAYTSYDVVAYSRGY